MPYRRLPQNDPPRTKALLALNARTNTLPTGQWLITTAQNATLQSLLSPWRNNQNIAAGQLNQQVTATADATECQARTARIISHFIQVLNLAIQRGALPPAARTHYQLDAGTAEVPSLTALSDVLLWAQNLEDGEAARINAGGQPLAWPTITEVTTEANLLRAASASQATKKDLFDQAQQAIANQRPAVDAFIKDAWDTIEYNLRHEPDAPSLRRKAREWGIIYINDDGTEETDPAPTPAPPPPAP